MPIVTVCTLCSSKEVSQYNRWTFQSLLPDDLNFNKTSASNHLDTLPTLRAVFCALTQLGPMFFCISQNQFNFRCEFAFASGDTTTCCVVLSQHNNIPTQNPTTQQLVVSWGFVWELLCCDFDNITIRCVVTMLSAATQRIVALRTSVQEDWHLWATVLYDAARV